VTIEAIRENYTHAKSAKIDKGEVADCDVCGSHSTKIGTGTHRYHRNSGANGPPTADLCDRCHAEVQSDPDDALVEELASRAIHRRDQAAGAEEHGKELKRRQDFLYRNARQASDHVESLLKPAVNKINDRLPQGETIQIILPGIGTTLRWGRHTANFMYHQDGGNFGEMTLTVTLMQQPSNFEAFGLPEFAQTRKVPDQILRFHPEWVQGDVIAWRLGNEVMTPAQVVDLVLRRLDERL